MEARSHW